MNVSQCGSLIQKHHPYRDRSIIGQHFGHRGSLKHLFLHALFAQCDLNTFLACSAVNRQWRKHAPKDVLDHLLYRFKVFKASDWQREFFVDVGEEPPLSIRGLSDRFREAKTIIILVPGRALRPPLRLLVDHPYLDLIQALYDLSDKTHNSARTFWVEIRV